MEELDSKLISIVVPVYNEEGAVSGLFFEIKKTLEALDRGFEIIFINDGSTDNTLNKLKDLSPIKIVNFSKNFGQTAALDAGIKAAKGEIVITMDGDGQNDPADIPALLNELEKGYDLVSGWRWDRKDPFLKKLISRLASLLRSVFIKDSIHDSGCTLKAYRSYCFDNVDLQGEVHRFIPALLQWQGFSIGEIKVNHRPRKTGKTKYSFSRIIKGGLDMLALWFWSKYSSRPLHLFGTMGLGISAIGLLLVTALFILRIFKLISLSGSVLPLTGFFLILTGVQLFIFGILSDISLKNYYKVHRKRPYRIKQIIEKK